MRVWVKELDATKRWIPHATRALGDTMPIKSPEQIMKEIAIEKWRRGGLERPVKVIAATQERRGAVSGYFTQEKCIKGQLLPEIERRLGFPTGMLSGGAYVMVVNRIPMIHEFDLRSYTNQPCGRPFAPGGKWPPGSGVPQWELKVSIPWKECVHVRPGQRY